MHAGPITLRAKPIARKSTSHKCVTQPLIHKPCRTQLGEGTICVEHKLRKELVLSVNASEKAVAFRIFNIEKESVDCQGGSPDEYDAGMLRNVIAYFYNLSVRREKIPRSVNASAFDSTS